MSTAEPLLRTLAPALRRLDQRLRAWLDSQRRMPLGALTQATLDGLSSDLQRQSGALDVDRPLLVIMFMGGTGVGKSSLLNALAKGDVAQASFARPTTRDPVVYYHESVRPDRLDPALQQCRMASHDRPGLEQKILVDTPDLDSNELANRDKLKALLKVADVVLYVGSQEKYHDKLGWELFLEQRRRRAFAFVLNKWDRCLHGATPSTLAHASGSAEMESEPEAPAKVVGGTFADASGSEADTRGVRPDDDLLRDLREEGFQDPLLFRTCAQAWIDANGQPPKLPEGEQFAELEHWLEMGLTRLEIEAIKARGVSQLLQQMDNALEAAKPPDLGQASASTRLAWERGCDDEGQSMADVLLATIDPYQREIEQHFALEGHRRFRGLMAGFLSGVTRLRYLGSSIRNRIPRPLRGESSADTSGPAWDLASFSKACSGLASERHLDARSRALCNHLLVLADQESFPVSILTDPMEAVSRLDWRQRFAAILLEVLHEVESQWVRPTGPRRWLESFLILLGDIVPWLALIGSSAILLHQYFWSDTPKSFTWSDLFLPLAAIFFSLLIMYAIVTLLLPLRWPAIRGTFHRQLAGRLREELTGVYLPLLEQLTDTIATERRQVQRLLAECREVADWLRQREQAASVAALYGSD